MTVPDAQPGPSDAALIAAWREGDESAAQELVRRHARALAGFLAAAGAREDLDDLVQETLFRAFRRIDRFRGSASFRTWLLTIGSNALKDLGRKRRRRLVLPLVDRDLPDPASDPHGELVERDLVARLADVVQQLPRLQRDVFLLRVREGLSYEEIAGALGTTPGAARVHYHHAAKRLKGAITHGEGG